MQLYWWYLPYLYSNYNHGKKGSFSVFSLITHEEINILLFGVFMILGKQKIPGDISLGVFCFPQGKQKTPGAIHNLKQSEIWMAPGVYIFPGS